MIASLLVIMVCWMFVVPPGAGADEYSHLVRGGAVIRGQWSGEEVGVSSHESHVLPDSYALPETCYAFRSEIPVNCAPPLQRTGADIVLSTRADGYQVWPHLVYGLPTLLPGPAAVWWARAIGALAVVALVGAALVLAGSQAARVGVVVALTPMAFGTFATVNPSAFVIAGAVGVWVAASRAGPWSPGANWLLAAGWAAMSLSRRDGLVWAVAVIALLELTMGWSALARWRAMGWGPRSVIALSTGATVVWGVTSSAVTGSLALSPLALVGVGAARSVWARAWSPRARAALAAGAAVATTAAVALVLSRRPGGWDGELARTIVGKTGTHLVQAIGVLGWLDAPLPWLVVAGWIAVVGVLAAGALHTESRRPLVAAAAIGLAVTSAWVLELLQGDTSGNYWQGRYSLPLLMGAPIMLAAAVRDRRVTGVALLAALALLNAGMWAAARRWGVGLNGSLRPWNWDTRHTPLPVVTLLVAHAVGTVGLAWAITRSHDATPEPIA